MKINYIPKDNIINKVEDFFNKFYPRKFLIDLENILEFKLNIEIRPVKELKNNCDIDALISSDWKIIYIDENSYMDERYYFRLRFSIAHEIGHFILHKEIFESFKIKSIEDYIKFISKISDEDYNKLETQANIFANNLLVPRDYLNIEKNKILNKINKDLNSVKDRKTLNAYLSIPLSKIFQVSEDAINIALDNLE